jgi:hypothetical protein
MLGSERHVLAMRLVQRRYDFCTDGTGENDDE